MITLYQRSDCPFCWKVRLALSVLNVSYQTVNITLGEANPQIQSLSPKGSVPVLVDDNVVIWESSVILEYLLDGPLSRALLPAHANARSQARLLQNYSDTVVGPAIRGLVFEKRSKPEHEWDNSLINSSESSWRACQAYLDGQLGDQAFFVQEFSVVECALIPRFAIADYYGCPIPAELKRLRDWFSRCQQKDCYRLTYPKVFDSSC